MEIWAHRGANHLATENTMDAFEAAVNAGVDGLELDVRLCGSGEVVVFHDPSMWRLTRKFVPVNYSSLEELRKHGLDPIGRKVPTLSEVLDAYAGKTKLILDLKGSAISNANLERAVRDDLLKHAKDCIDQITISSADPLSLCKSHVMFEGAKPQIAYIMEKRFRPSLSHHILKYDAIHVEASAVNRSRVRKWKNMGMKVRVWTVNSPYIAENFATTGVDGIITDVPEEML